MNMGLHAEAGGSTYSGPLYVFQAAGVLAPTRNVLR